MFKDGSKTTFVPTAVLVLILISLESIIVFIDGVVRQMHEQVVQVAFGRAYVFTCRKSSQTFLINKDPKWIYSIDQSIDTQIELKPIKEIRLM